MDKAGGHAKLGALAMNPTAMRVVFLIFVAVFLLAGCGSKGPLFLPTAQTEQALPANEDQGSDEKKEKTP